MLKRQELTELNESVNRAEQSIEGIKKGFESEYRKIVTRKDKLAEMEKEREEQARLVLSMERVTD